MQQLINRNVVKASTFEAKAAKFFEAKVETKARLLEASNARGQGLEVLRPRPRSVEAKARPQGQS